ncbi:sulfatase-like hydrolase/transferase [Enterococcus ratti]|uniref:sulfatase-like hydrolase/transferase n=1 Tax=Enterococcus ratti TaxID=150033 RepID=UPI00351364CE
MRAIMIMFDTLARDFLSNYGNKWIKTPNFDRLREKTVTFDNFYGGSMPCMPARRELHTGRYNFMHRMWGQLEPFDHSIFDVLQKNNVYCHLVTDHSHYFEDGGATYHNRYSTWEGFRGQEGDRWVPRKEGEKTQFYHPLNKSGVSVTQHFANRTRQVNEEEMSSVQTIQAGLTFLENYKNEDQWFLQIECFDPHEPFYVPEKYRKLYEENPTKTPYFWPKYGRVTEEITEENLIELQKEYASLISMCDHHLGKILDFVEKNNMWKDTLIIVNTDHGFLLGEHNWLGKNVAPMYEEIIHLPFFINYPSSTIEKSCQVLSQTIDIPATLLDYFEIENRLDMDGKSLLPILRKEDTQLHEWVIFGTNGGHVNIYDGRYVYMRASVHPDNGPITVQTLNFSQMRGFFTKDILDKMVLKEGNRFTNQYPYIELAVSTFIDSYSVGHLLFDLKEDPKQENPLNNPELEKKMMEQLVKMMDQIEAPTSEYVRLGLLED